MKSTPDEGLYQILLNTIPMSVLLIARDMRVVLANRNFLEKGLRTEEDTIGRRLQEVFPPPILDNTEIIRRIQDVFETSKPTQGEKMTYRAPGGLMRTYYYHILPLGSWDAVETVVLLMEDVTEQVRLSEDIRRMERHLAIVVESTSEILLSTDPRGRILSWNNSAERISGYSSQEVQNRFFFEFCGREQQDEVRRMLAEWREGPSSRTTEWNFVEKSGGVIPIVWTCSPMLDERATLVGIVAVGRDLTEHRKLEAQLLQAQKLAALGVMAGGIAHELRNPLAICSAAAQFLMKEEIAPEFRRECAQKVGVGVSRASTIIEHLLKFARPSERKDFEILDLIPVLHETLVLVDNQARIQGIEVSAEFPAAPVLVHGDAHLLQQVFMNLLLNAVNAMPDGGRLTVRADTAAYQVTVRVTDTGHGIPPEVIGNIFDPFFARSTENKGTGLGLPLCYAIVKQHGGSIEVQSVPEQGSTFTVTLNTAPA
ncbi:MAG: PAS domain-containing protein [Opitutaceae bacterium]|nr:PAS domain-containing protein [Opitutaceae bacterium]